MLVALRSSFLWACTLFLYNLGCLIASSERCLFLLRPFFFMDLIMNSLAVFPSLNRSSELPLLLWTRIILRCLAGLITLTVALLASFARRRFLSAARFF